MRCLSAAPGSATTRSRRASGAENFSFRKWPGGSATSCRRRDADRDRDALGGLEVEADDVEREVRLDDLAGAATRHREDLAGLERQPRLGLLGAREALGRVLRLAELEAAEERRERRAPGHAAASASSKRRWNPSGVEGVAPARTASLRIVQRSFAASGSSDPSSGRRRPRPRGPAARGFCPARARPRRAARIVSSLGGGRRAPPGKPSRRDRSASRREGSAARRRPSTEHSLLEVLGRRLRPEPEREERLGELLALDDAELLVAVRDAWCPCRACTRRRASGSPSCPGSRE